MEEALLTIEQCRCVDFPVADTVAGVCSWDQQSFFAVDAEQYGSKQLAYGTYIDGEGCLCVLA